VAVEKVVPVQATCEEALPALGVKIHQVPGYKHGELGYEVDVPDGKALILCDVVANRDHPPGLGGVIMAALAGGVKGRLGVPRIVRFMLLKDRPAGRAALDKLAEIPRLCIVTVGHGKPVVGGAADALREAAASL
jgi:hypothetical protein